MKYFERLRAVHPIVHCITNYVTVNDCANLLLACGASPIMADEEEEAEEITAIAHGLLLNIGTLNARTVRAMLRAGKKANALHRPILLDPVGAGASKLRTETARKIIAELHPAIVRCNASELKALLHTGGASRGVDAALSDRISEESIRVFSPLLRAFVEKYRCLIAVSGEIDLIAGPEGGICAIRNGVPEMELVTGSGCMLSALCAAFVSAAPPDRMFEAVCEAFCAMGIAGERALKQTGRPCPTASFRAAMIDALSAGMPEMEREVRCEMLP